MKQKLSTFFILAAVFSFSCNNSSTSSTTSDTSTTTSTPTMTDTSHAATNASTASPTGSATPFGKEDSSFIMKAAVGGMEEVASGNLAQQNAVNQRVKDFGSMMVTDHGNANNQLKSLASQHGLNIPDSLPTAKQKHQEAMKKMQGKAFDSHYVGMMLSDHEKDVAEFKKEANSAKDPDLKNWINNTLPVLQKHLDSIKAISKSVH
jgi:putative membrane protein